MNNCYFFVLLYMHSYINANLYAHTRAYINYYYILNKIIYCIFIKMKNNFDLNSTDSMYFTADFTLIENYESTPIVSSNRAQQQTQSRIKSNNQ